MAEIVRDLEFRFDVDERIYVVQVCSPDEHSAAPVTRSGGKFDVMIVTAAADNLADFHRGDPTAITENVIQFVGARMPAAPQPAIDAFRAQIMAWIGEHRRAGRDVGD